MTVANQMINSTGSNKIEQTNYHLAELVDIGQLQKLFDLQYQFTGLPVCLSDTEGNLLITAGWQNFDADFRKLQSVSSEQIKEGRAQTKTTTKNKKYIGYKNQLGLREHVLLVKLAGQLKGQVHCGPFLFEDEAENVSGFEPQTQKFNLDGKKFGQLLKLIPRLKKEQVEQITDYYSALVDMITDQACKNLMEQEDRKNRSFLKSIYEGADMPMFVVAVDETNDFRFRSVNRAHEKLTGMKSSLVTGKTPEELPGIPPEAAKKVRQNYERCIRAGKSIRYKEMIPMFGKETHWLTTLTPLKDKAGKIDHIVGTAMFINELVETQRELEMHRKNLEKKVKERTGKLKESEEKHRAVFESATDAFIIAGLDGKIVEANPSACKIYGYSYREIIQKTATDLIHPDYHYKFPRFIENIQKKGNYQDETKDVKKDGSTFATEVHGTLISYNNEKHMLAIVRDISEKKEISQKLKAEKEFTDSVINAMPGVFYLFDRNGKFLKWNQALAEMAGFTNEQISKKTPPEFIAPHHREKVTKAIQAAFQTGEVLVEADFFAANKTPVPILFSGKIIRQNNEPLLVGIGMDITKRVQAEKEKEKILADLQERIKEITCLYNINALFKKAPDKLDKLLQKAVEIIPAGWKYPEKTSAEILFDDLSVKSRNFKITGLFQSESIIIDEEERGKVVIYLDASNLEETAGFLPQEKSLLSQIAFNLSQYIDKLEYEEALEESEAKFRNIIRYSPLPKAILDLDQNVEFVNESFTGTIGYTKDEVPDIDSWWKTAFPDKRYREKLKKEWDKAMEYAITVERASDPVEARITCKNGQIRTFNVIGNKVGEQFVIVFSDLTERIHAQEKMQQLVAEMERSNHDLEQFAYVASHDLQEPLRMVSSYTQLLQRRYKGKLDGKADKYIYYAVDGAVRMQHLINDLLEFSRITTRGKEFISTDVNEVVNTAVKNLELQVKKTRAQITWNVLPEVKADKPQLERLFMNLIGNAIKFRKTGEKPVIHISAKPEDDHLIFSVKDNGIGISPDFKEKIFVIFQRLHGAGEYPGTGIGLAISKQIVQRHGGDIWYESDEKNGTTFYFSLKK